MTAMHAVVAGWLLEDRPSGACRRLLGLLEAACPHLREGERLTLLHSPNGSPPTLPDKINLQPIDIPAQPTWRRAWRERRRLPAALRSLGATVFDLSSLPVPAGLPCPAILTIHDLRDLTDFRRRPRAISRHILRRSLLRAHRLISPSEFTAKHLRESFKRIAPAISVIPAGIDEDFFRADPPPLADPPFFLHVGHLEPRKNLELLLTAFAQFTETHSSRHQLFLVGADHGDSHWLCGHAADLGIRERVFFLGVVTEQRLHDLYQEASAVLTPSLYEGFGMTPLEALAAGKPTLVSDRGALPEVVGEAGVVLPGTQASAWATALSSLAEGTDHPEDRARRIARAREFSWQRAGGELVSLWREASA